MIILNVYFSSNLLEYGSTATLLENLITNEVQLFLSSKLFLGEVKKFIDDATRILKHRYKNVTVKIHWDSTRQEEDDINVATSK